MFARGGSVTHETLGRFTCNICGARNHSAADASARETATCLECRSTIRFRSLMLELSRALFGLDLTMPEFPVLKSIRGMGFSDSEVYSGRLGQHFSYTNTFYHREPAFDLSRPDEREFGKYDFVLCSEVLEHVPDPAQGAFDVLSRLLKPGGVLILTVPYSLGAETVEHYPGRMETGFAELDGRTVMVGRSAEGEYRVFDGLTFHGGSGSTLERRVFSEASLRAELEAAGFPIVRFEVSGSREFGVVYSSPCSLPIVALRGPFALGRSGMTELIEELRKARGILKDVRESRWVKFGRCLGLGPDLR